MKLKTLLISTFILLTQNLLLAQTKLVQTDNGYQLTYNGKPYYIKGAGGDGDLDLLVKIGGNSIRTWGSENAEQILNEAQRRGLTVMLGLWLQHERHGFDYNNKEKVQKQLNHFKTVVDKYKNHPALLFWGIGNELDLEYTNTNVWSAVQDIAKYIHETDPNHPTSTVTAGLDSNEVVLIKKLAPDIDIYCVNTYGDIARVPEKIADYGWNGPYIITEWGPNGHWESPNTSWKVAIEQSSREKRNSYYERYTKYIEPNKNKCLGAYVFLWGAKQEYTETWYGLFSKNNLPTEAIDVLELSYSGKASDKPAPSLVSMELNQQQAKDNIKLKSGNKYTASVNAMYAVGLNQMLPDSNQNFKYHWRILSESTDKKSGGDVEDAAVEICCLIKKGNTANIELRAPVKEGAYRLLVTVTANNKVAYANIPFWVNPRNAKDGQARFIQFKKTDMSSFKNP